VTSRPQPDRPPTPAPPIKKGDDPTPTKPKDSDPYVFTPVKPSSTKPLKDKPKKTDDTQVADANAAAQADAARKMSRAISGLTTTLGKDKPVQIGTSSDTAADNANYSDIVYSTYFAAWHPPASLTDEAAAVTVRVTISRNGQVTHHEIITPSGNSSMDRSIELTLDNVMSIAPFPDNSKDLERSYSIKFNLSAKKSM